MKTRGENQKEEDNYLIIFNRPHRGWSNTLMIRSMVKIQNHAVYSRFWCVTLHSSVIIYLFLLLLLFSHHYDLTEKRVVSDTIISWSLFYCSLFILTYTSWLHRLVNQLWAILWYVNTWKCLSYVDIVTLK